MKYFLTSIILMTVISFVVNGQTTISGGIYTNTTWTLANSPYTADTVVVFPNVTLTIEPGVVVIVNGNLEIRQSKLIAEGTITDSITFIGSLPILGDTLSNITVYFHDALSSRMNYCIIKDNPDRGMEARMNSSSDSLTIKNSYFTNNGTGLYCSTGIINADSCLFKNNSTGVGQTSMTITNSTIRKSYKGLSAAQNAIIRNCVIDSNNVGIESSGLDIITNCQIKNNGIGINCITSTSYGSQIHNNIIENDSIGILLSNNSGQNLPDSIYCNQICNNTTYNIKVTTIYYSSAANNYWCTSDSLTVANSIYDGYDNASYALLYFMPIDTSSCYLATAIPIYDTQPISFSIFPNPVSDYITIELPSNNSQTKINIFNMLGELEFYSKTETQKTKIDVSTLTLGLHIIQIATEDKIISQKLIKQ